jgi:chemotaxis protein MotB
MRRRHRAEHVNHERWLVSYADFITLLFAFFVVMYASTQADRTKAKAVSDSVRDALQPGQFSSALSTMLGRGRHESKKEAQTKLPVDRRENPPPPQLPEPPPPSQPADLVKSLSYLQDGLATELKSGKLQVKLEDRGLVISMREATFFASGDDTIAPASFPIMSKIAEVVQSLPNPVRLEGHTDSRPIHNSRFRNNWELSAARSIAMLALLRDRFQIDTARMAVAGYAENVPADNNDTDEGRAHNRRVDLVLLTTGGMAKEPRASR